MNEFALNLEGELLSLRRQLQGLSWKPGGFRQFTIYERKPRLISAAPFADRVVHHALMRVIEPPLDRQFIYDSYACRKGKGVHQAVDRYQYFARRYAYVLKFDIASYFPSVDHEILKMTLHRRIKDKSVLWLCETIIDHSPPALLNQQLSYFNGDDLLTPLERSRGIPIGNLTSQFFANLYLDQFDHWMCEQKRVPGYIRFVDDIFVFTDSLDELWRYLADAEHYLAGLRLRIHPHKQQVHRCTEAVDVLGYRVSRCKRWLRNDNGHRFNRRLKRLQKQYAAGTADWDTIGPAVAGWCGHARHGETESLQEQLLYGTVFRRGVRH